MKTYLKKTIKGLKEQSKRNKLIPFKGELPIGEKRPIAVFILDTIGGRRIQPHIEFVKERTQN